MRSPILFRSLRSTEFGEVTLVVLAEIHHGAQHLQIGDHGIHLGLAFQGADDLLDVTGSAESLLNNQDVQKAYLGL